MQPQISQEQFLEMFNKLKNDVDSLSGAFYKNNFSGSQTFNKDAIFQTRLRVPVYSSAPSVAEVGDIICISGTFYGCTVAGNVSSPATFTVIGTQS